MKKLLLGFALGFGAHRLSKATFFRNFLRRKSARIGSKFTDTIVDIWIKNGMTQTEFDILDQAVDILSKRSSRKLKLVENA